MNTDLIRSDSHLDNLDPKEYIIIKRARDNNLKNLSVAIPRNKLVVITGLSGSGKSSLAFDTLYAEGQRRYVEGLSSQARQFLDQLERPDVDLIEGLPPTVAIDQKSRIRRRVRCSIPSLDERSPLRARPEAETRSWASLASGCRSYRRRSSERFDDLPSRR